jgi:hypothetical protein
MTEKLFVFIKPGNNEGSKENGKKFNQFVS